MMTRWLRWPEIARLEYYSVVALSVIEKNAISVRWEQPFASIIEMLSSLAVELFSNCSFSCTCYSLHSLNKLPAAGTFFLWWLGFVADKLPMFIFLAV